MDSILEFLEDLIPNSTKHLEENYKKIINHLKDLKERIPASIEDCVNLDEVERLGMAKLDLNAISYYISGANNEITLARNRKYFNKILLNQKILKNVSKISLETEVLGRKIAFPVCFSPTAIQKMAHEDGEIATAKAAYKNNTIMILSSLSSTSLEDVAKENKTGIRWFQLYAMKERIGTIHILQEAEKHGFSAIVLTVDAPILGYRDRDFQVKFQKPQKINYEIQHKVIKHCEEYYKNNGKNGSDGANYAVYNSGSVISETKSDIFNVFTNNIDSSLSLDFIDWLRQQTKLPIVIKGILNSEDALIAAEKGIDAIMISNHGGRQLDTVPATIEVLGPIVDKLNDYFKKNPNKKGMEVYIDGGIRRGSDVLKALALGAKAVFVGRPLIWGLAAGGDHGVDKVLDILRNEFIVAMKLTGSTTINEISRECLYDGKGYVSKSKF